MKVTQKMIDIVADEWTEQHNYNSGVNLTPDNCDGMKQEEIDATVEWLRKNN